jgi:hypothetical protein
VQCAERKRRIATDDALGVIKALVLKMTAAGK